jgi:hypothetical protein
VVMTKYFAPASENKSTHSLGSNASAENIEIKSS